MAAGILPPGLIAPGLRHVVRKQRNARVLLAEVHDVDLEQKVAHATEPGGQPLDLSYDTLVAAAGATHSGSGRSRSNSGVHLPSQGSGAMMGTAVLLKTPAVMVILTQESS